MGQPAAKQGDRIVALDMHLIQPPGPVSPAPVPHPFNGIINGALSSNVFIEGRAAATLNSTATNLPSHIPQGGSFVIPPTNKGTIVTGSATVRINGQAAARAGDQAITCDDVTPVLPKATVVAQSKVLIGG
jgi:uncharacterized Zn-binding protein involved in type VI secretion